MLDLNHGSGPLDAPFKPAINIAEAVNARIDAALARKNEAQAPRNYIGASELGDPCLRRVYYNAIKADRTPFTGQKLRVFEMGRAFEALVADWIKAAGFDLRTHDLAARQFEFVTGNGRIKGHSDGVLAGGPRIPDLAYPALWENKALKGRYWNALVKKGLRSAEPKYFAQVQLYLGYFELPNALFTAINKDTAEIYHAVIPYEVAEAQRYSDRGVDLIRAVDAQNPPPRIASSPDFYACRMCNFAETICWRDRWLNKR